jgi:hypothetical protein
MNEATVEQAASDLFEKIAYATLQVIFQTALYLQVRAPEIPHPYPANLLTGAVSTK